MSFPNDVLQNLQVAHPCAADWDSMAGSGRVRHCSTCRLPVHYLSNLTRQQAEELLQSDEGRLCIRFAQSADGSVQTKDCPPPDQVPWRPNWRLAAALSIVFFMVGAIALAALANESPRRPLTQLPIVGPVLRWLGFEPPQQNWIMGKR